MTIQEEIVQLQPGIERFHAELENAATIYVTVWNADDEVIDYFEQCVHKFAHQTPKSNKYYRYYYVDASYHCKYVFDYFVALCKLFNKKYDEIVASLGKEIILTHERTN